MVAPNGERSNCDRLRIFKRCGDLRWSIGKVRDDELLFKPACADEIWGIRGGSAEGGQRVLEDSGRILSRMGRAIRKSAPGRPTADDCSASLDRESFSPCYTQPSNPPDKRCSSC